MKYIPRPPVVLLTIVLLVGCSEPDPPPAATDDATATVAETAPEPPAPGDLAIVRRSGDTDLNGVAMKVRRADGTEVDAIFLGPRKLAETWSGGDFTAQEDSLSRRVRMLAEGERLESRDR